MIICSLFFLASATVGLCDASVVDPMLPWEATFGPLPSE